jgi:hypothetical protein
MHDSEIIIDRLCGLVARVPGYRSRGPGATGFHSVTTTMLPHTLFVYFSSVITQKYTYSYVYIYIHVIYKSKKSSYPRNRAVEAYRVVRC